ncbi:MAG: hypothetical protein JW814_07560 [Candidatus Krumholzibacteriota bacterium]|nr:hypothetical protein [Candidatus Krumholzibacteriota bacterium]
MLQNQGNEKGRQSSNIFFHHAEGDPLYKIKKRYHDRFEKSLECCGDLLAGHIGPDNLKSLLLTGSFSIGEGSILFGGESPVFLSDIDLLAIIEDKGLLMKLLPEKERLSGECESLFPDAVFDGHVDVGIVTAGETGRFPRSPGVYDINRRAIVLRGDLGASGFFPDFRPEEVDRREGIILLENRIASFIGEWPPDTSSGPLSRHHFLYQAAKGYADIITASLCVSGNFISGYRERAEYVAGAGEDDPGVRLAGQGAVMKALEWSEYKLDPSGKVPPFSAGTDRSLWFEVAADLLGCWKRCESFIQGGAAVGAEEQNASDLFAGRRTKSFKKDYITAWRCYLRDKPFRTVASTVFSVGLALARSSPLEKLREAGVLLLDHAVSRGTGSVIGPNDRIFLAGEGDWAKAAGRLSDEWNRLVFGRKG